MNHSPHYFHIYGKTEQSRHSFAYFRGGLVSYSDSFVEPNINIFSSRRLISLEGSKRHIQFLGFGTSVLLNCVPTKLFWFLCNFSGGEWVADKWWRRLVCVSFFTNSHESVSQLEWSLASDACICFVTRTNPLQLPYVHWFERTLKGRWFFVWCFFVFFDY